MDCGCRPVGCGIVELENAIVTERQKMNASPLLQQRAAKSGNSRATKRPQSASQNDMHIMQQLQLIQVTQSPRASVHVKYKSQEEYFDEVNDLKQENRKLKESNAYLLGRVRSLEKQLHSEDRLLNLNVSMPANKLSLDTVSQMATTGGSPRLTAPAPKLDGQGSGANSVHLLVCKKQILALKTELEAAKSRCTELENDVRRSNLQQWRIEKDAYYQEVLRLQAVIRMKDQEEKLRLANRPAAVQSAVQTDPITVNAYSDLALKQILSQRDPQLQMHDMTNMGMLPKSPATPKVSDRQVIQVQQVSRLKALLCTIMTQAQKIRGLEHENRMLRVRIEVEQSEARKSIQDFVSGRLDRMKAELDGRESDIAFVSMQNGETSDEAFDSERVKGKSLGEDWILRELLIRGDRIQELESEIRELRMQISQMETGMKHTHGRAVMETTDEEEFNQDNDAAGDETDELIVEELEEPERSFSEEAEKPFEETPDQVAAELPHEVILLPESSLTRLQPAEDDPDTIAADKESESESPSQPVESLDDESVNDLADLLRGYVVCKSKARNLPATAKIESESESLDADEVDMLTSLFVAHRNNKQRQQELLGKQQQGLDQEQDQEAFEKLQAALLAHSARKQSLRGPQTVQNNLDEQDVQTLMDSLTAHQTRIKQLQKMEFLNGARTKQYSKV